MVSDESSAQTPQPMGGGERYNHKKNPWGGVGRDGRTEAQFDVRPTARQADRVELHRAAVLLQAHQRGRMARTKSQEQLLKLGRAQQRVRLGRNMSNSALGKARAQRQSMAARS